VEITVYIRSPNLTLGMYPDDKRKPTSKDYPNNPEGFEALQLDLTKALNEAGKRVHVFHSEATVS
jgi:hypothetical protein